jgi:hypothetical protein
LGERAMNGQTQTYEKKIRNLLSGSLNLLPPGDAIGEADALILENWRPQQDVELRSRLGNITYNATAAGNITSIFKIDIVNSTIWYGDDQGHVYKTGFGLFASGFQGVGSPLLTNPGQWPISMTSAGGNLYAVTQNKQVRIGWTATGGAATANNSTDVVAGGQLSAPISGTVTAVSGGSFSNGENVTYYITFATKDGDTDGYLISWTSPGDNESAVLHLPTYSDSHITGINVYRQNGQLTQPYLVNRTPLASGATYTDTASNEQSDDAIAGYDNPFGLGMQKMPPAAVIAGPYFGHLLMGNSTARPSRFWWSKQGNYNGWPGAAQDGNDLADGNWADVGDDLDPIVAISCFPQFAIIYRVNSIYRLVGDPDDQYSTLEPLVEGFGISGPMARCRAGRFDYFGSTDGIYRLDGESLMKVSRKLQKVFDTDVHEIPGVMPPMPVPPQRYGMALGHRNNRVYVSYNDGTATP